MFDTETMAELCVKQGLVDQAIGVFRRMAAASEDPATRQRCEERIAALEHAPGHVPLETPGLRVHTRQGEIDIEWRLPTGIAAPALQLLVLRRTPQGIAPTRGRSRSTRPTAGPRSPSTACTPCAPPPAGWSATRSSRSSACPGCRPSELRALRARVI
jgi:hypothetical protein